MRILHYTDSLQLGGKERQLVELLKGLGRRRGVESMVVCMEEGGFFVSGLRELNVPLRFLTRRFRWDPLVFAHFYKTVREFGPDIIHTNSMMTSFYALPLSKLLGVP